MNIPLILQTLFSSSEEAVRTYFFPLLEQSSVSEEEYQSIRYFCLENLKKLPETNKETSEIELNQIKQKKQLFIDGMRILLKKTPSTEPSSFIKNIQDLTILLLISKDTSLQSNGADLYFLFPSELQDSVKDIVFKKMENMQAQLFAFFMSKETNLQSVGFLLYFLLSSEEQQTFKQFLLNKMEENPEIDNRIYDLYGDLDNLKNFFMKHIISNNAVQRRVCVNLYNSLPKDKQIDIQRKVVEQIEKPTSAKEIENWSKIFSHFIHKSPSLLTPLFKIALHTPSIAQLLDAWIKNASLEEQAMLRKEILNEIVQTETDTQYIAKLIRLISRCGRIAHEEMISFLKLPLKNTHYAVLNHYKEKASSEEKKTLELAVLNEMESDFDSFPKWTSIFEQLINEQKPSSSLNVIQAPIPSPVTNVHTPTQPPLSKRSLSTQQENDPLAKKKRLEEPSTSKISQEKGQAPQASQLRLGLPSTPPQNTPPPPTGDLPPSPPQFVSKSK